MVQRGTGCSATRLPGAGYLAGVLLGDNGAALIMEARPQEVDFLTYRGCQPPFIVTCMALRDLLGRNGDMPQQGCHSHQVISRSHDL